MFIHKEGNYISTSNNEELTLKHRKMMQLEHLQLATSLERDVIQVVIHKSINWTEQQTEATWHQTEKRAHWGVPSMLPPADSTKVAKRSWRSWSNGSSMTLWWMLIWSSSVPVAVASSECFWRFSKYMIISYYIVFPMVSPVAWYKPLWAPPWMTSQLSTSPTTSHLRFSTNPVEESRQLRDQAKVVGPHDLADHRTKNHQKPEVVLDGALKTQHLVDIDHWPPTSSIEISFHFCGGHPLLIWLDFGHFPSRTVRSLGAPTCWWKYCRWSWGPLGRRGRIWSSWRLAKRCAKQQAETVKPIRCQKNVAGWEIH